MSLVNAARLRSIAATVRQLPGFYHFPTVAARYFKTVGEGAKFIREAECLGAFRGDSIYGRIGKELAHPRCHMDHDGPTPAGNMPAWRLPVWYAVVDTLAPALMRKRSRSMVIDASRDMSMLLDTSPEEAEIVARAIEAEADRLEAESKANKQLIETPKSTMRKRKKQKRKRGGQPRWTKQDFKTAERMVAACKNGMTEKDAETAFGYENVKAVKAAKANLKYHLRKRAAK